MFFFFSLLFTISCSCIVYLNATFSETISYVVTDRVDDSSNGNCMFRIVWSTGLKQTHSGDYFGCKERETQLNETVYVVIRDVQDYERDYGGYLPWYIGVGVTVWSAIFIIVGIVCSIFSFIEIKDNE